MDWGYTLANQLLDGLDNHYINEETIKEYSYSHLIALLCLARQLNNGAALYQKIKSHLEELNIRRLQSQEKIKVGFIANFASTWIGDELYRLFADSERFEPYVFVLSNHNVAAGQSMESTVEEYLQNLSYFQKQDLRAVETLDPHTGRQYTWEEMGGKPDICIWLTPWTDLFREHFHLLYYSLDTLHAYIPYGFMLADNAAGNFAVNQYDQLLHNTAWKIFETSRSAMQMAQKYSFVKGSNAVYTGYPKMDSFYDKSEKDKGPWSEVLHKAGNPQAKKIIYAPHHSLEGKDMICYATFAANYMAMLELAEKYQDETVWIFKPHPQLKYKTVRSGVFADEGEWDSYVQRWKDLKNGTVMEEGAYDELFLQSDAMILDSLSFIAEYLYVDKPLLFLKREESRLNEQGMQILSVQYSAAGENIQAIEDFVETVVLEGQDVQRDARERFFADNFDYVKDIGASAVENIYRQFQQFFGAEQRK